MGATNGGGGTGTRPATKTALSPARRRLVELMQEVNFGWIDGLMVQGGEPIFDPPPRTRRTIVLGKDYGAHTTRASADFALKETVTELFDVFDREQFLAIDELVIDHGLPVRMTVADGTRA